jgi:hypothetical protein
MVSTSTGAEPDERDQCDEREPQVEGTCGNQERRSTAETEEGEEGRCGVHHSEECLEARTSSDGWCFAPFARGLRRTRSAGRSVATARPNR